MMKEQFIKEIQQRMLHYLNNEQLMQLGQVLNECFQCASITYEENFTVETPDTVEKFITAKRIEGCSEKTLKYYQKTIETMVFTIGKTVQQITTDDLREYLTDYQTQR